MASFTVGAGGFGKLGPQHGQTGLGSNVTLQWAALPDSGYWVCWDTTDNGSCDGMWWPNGASTAKPLEGLSPGTYYWQAKAMTPNGEVVADGGTWWSFTVSGGAGTFTKIAPALGLAGLSSNLTLSWSAVPDDGYLVCWDQINNGECDTMWWPNGASTSKPVEGLAPGTYFWQVKTASNGTQANSSTWWSFTVGAQVTSFSKTTPANGGVLTANVANLTWAAAEGAQFYEVCIDTINNGQCDTMWVSNALSTGRLLGGLTDGTFYWQVRVTTGAGPAWANDGAWWTIHVDAPDPIREYIYLGGRLLASLTLTTGTPVLTHYHTDALGSVRAITDASGNPLVRHDYAAFGESISSLQGDPRRYLGQERDVESAMDHLGAREYRNIWGRFTAVDPIFSASARTRPQLWNRYAYALNTPQRFADPSGLEPQDTRGEFPDVSGERFDFDSFAAQQSFQQLLQPTGIRLTPEEMKMFLAALLVSIGQATAAIHNPYMGWLPLGYREASFTIMRGESGRLWILPYEPGHWQVPSTQGGDKYRYDQQIPQWFVFPEPNQSTIVLPVHVHPTRWNNQGPTTADRTALGSGWGLVIELDKQPVAIFYNADPNIKNITMPLSVLLGGLVGAGR